MKTNDIHNPSNYSVRFGMSDYFTRCVTLTNITGVIKTLTGATPHTRSEGNMLIIVTEGSGKLIVNNEVHKIKRGSFACLGPFHTYSIVPENASTMKLAYCCIDPGIYMYIMSCPYVKVNTFEVPQGAIVAQISEADTERVEGIFDFLSNEKKDDYFINKIKYMYVMELFGILLHESNKKKTANAKSDLG